MTVGITDKDRKKYIDIYWKRKDEDSQYSLRWLAGEYGLSYYTVRDWFRSPKYNSRWKERNHYSSQVRRLTNEDNISFFCIVNNKEES